MNTLRKKDIGRYGTFTGFDSRTYFGKVTNVRKGIVEFTYDVTNQHNLAILQNVKTYLEKDNIARLKLD